MWRPWAARSEAFLARCNEVVHVERHMRQASDLIQHAAVVERIGQVLTRIGKNQHYMRSLAYAHATLLTYTMCTCMSILKVACVDRPQLACSQAHQTTQHA